MHCYEANKGESATASLQSHLIAFAAEHSRLTGGMPIEIQSILSVV